MISPLRARGRISRFCSSVPDVTDDVGHHQCRANAIGGRPGALELLGKGQHLERIAALTAELLGPPRSQQSMLDPGPVKVPVVMDAGRVHPLPNVGR